MVTSVGGWDLITEIGLADSPKATSPTWTDFSAVIMAGDGVSLSRGATSGEQASAGQFSFTIDLDAMAALHMTAVTGAQLLRRPVRFRARNAAGTIRELGRFHVTDTTTLRDGRKRIRVSGTDAFALWDETKRGGDMAWHLTRCGAVRRWKLDDEGPVARDAFGSGVELTELEVADAAGGADTYGTVSWGSSTVPSPSGAGVVHIEAADVFGNGGFTALTGWTPTGLPFALSVWVRVPEPPMAPDGWPAPPFALHVPAIQVQAGTFIRWLGLSVDRATGAVLPATGWVGPAGGGSATGTIDCGYGWVHVDYVLPASGSASLWFTRPDGTSEDLSSSVASDRLADLIGSAGARLSAGPTSLLVGGTTAASAGVLLVKPAAVEVSDLVLSQPTIAGRTSLVRSAIGWPNEAPSARLARIATEAGLPVPTLTATSAPAMTSQADTETTALDGWREVESVLLGLLHLRADGTAALRTRSELEDVASVATLPSTLVLADSDGITNNTSMIVNAATVTALYVSDVSASDADTVSTNDRGERSDPRSIATVNADWLALSAGWLAYRLSDPSRAYGLPNLTLDPDDLARRRPAGDSIAALPWTADIGDVLTLTGLADTSIEVQIMAVSWAVQADGQWRCSWTVRPHSTDYFDIDGDDIDGTAILGW